MNVFIMLCNSYYFLSFFSLLKIEAYMMAYMTLSNLENLPLRSLAGENITECTGLWMLTWGLASLVGPSIVGHLFDALHSYRYTNKYKISTHKCNKGNCPIISCLYVTGLNHPLSCPIFIIWKRVISTRQRQRQFCSLGHDNRKLN